MTSAQAILVALWTAVTLYAILGGADFGGGVLDLVARGPRAQRQRIAVSRAMGPVWEANHVWLIFFVTGLFSAFPRAFETLSVALFVPATLALAGVVLRGAAFAFRSHTEGADLVRSTLGVVFGAASVITPLLFGAAAGGLATGAIHYHAGRVTTDGAVWIGPLPAASGLLAIAVCAYLAATFLCVEMQRAGESQLLEDFRRRALAAGLVAGGLSIAALPLAHADAPRLYERLTGVAVPAAALGVAAGAASLAALWWRRHRLARGACATAVAAVIWGWGIAQYPQLAGPDVTVGTAAAPQSVLTALLAGGGAGLLVLAPSLWLLYVVSRPPATDERRGSMTSGRAIRLSLARDAIAPALVAWTLVAPWALGASDSPAALAGHIAFAMAFLPLALLARALPPAAVTCVLGGLWLAVSPLVLGFASEAVLALNDVVVGWSLVASQSGRLRRRRPA